ncbi:hypothetical protein ACFQGT_02315 [Natrialbaceae archaeon GCM10025810]|uniref:hypothetical protein n=1 Tax=Halovalidus salilacus TaxID=3075124 RepID=UPI00360C9745
MYSQPAPLWLPARQRDLLAIGAATDGGSAAEIERDLEDATRRIRTDETIADELTALLSAGFVRKTRPRRGGPSVPATYAVTDHGSRALEADLEWRTNPRS